MMTIPTKTKLTILTVLLLTLPMLEGCGNGDSDATPIVRTSVAEASASPEDPVEKVTITIGNISDLTGVSAAAMEIINMALHDMVKYYNERELIPGVNVEVITYDGQYDPARDIPGYLWLKERGADLIFTAIPATAEILKSRLEQDNIVLFGVAPSEAGYLPPGYSFCGSVLPRDLASTYLNWIAENDWDYRIKGPARIGAVDWTNPRLEEQFSRMEEYCTDHPDQFEWAGGHLVSRTFTWGPEVDALKDCDYVQPPVAALVGFAREYRAAGYSAKFIGSDAHAAFFGLIDDASLWDELDGMLFARESRWWNEEGELINLIKNILYDYHPDSAGETMKRGASYLAISNAFLMLEIISRAVEIVGPDRFSSEAFYDAAISLSLTVGDYGYSFSETKRMAGDYLGIYCLDGSREDLFRVDPEWQPIIYNP